MQTQFDLAVASLGLQVTGPAGWLTPMQRAWSAWESTTPSAWKVDIMTDAELPTSDHPLFEALPRCRAGTCTLEAPGFCGYVSSENATAQLHAHTTAAPNDIGYFLRVVMAVQAFAVGGMLFHTAGVVRHGQGYALFGVSGSGKTTASQLSAPSPVLNDDLVLLSADDAGWMMYATPFGKRRGDQPSAPLRALLRLVQDPEVFLAPMSKSQALAELVANTPVISADPERLPELMMRWEALMATVPAFSLHFRKDPTFWEVVDAEFG